MNNLKKCLTIILLVCMSFTTVYASGGVNATVSFNPTTGAVTVAGTSNGPTVIKALPYGTESLITPSNPYTHFDQITGNELPYTFYMSTSAPYGKYSVYVVSVGSDADTFMYYDPVAADGIIPSLNASSSGEKLADAIKFNAPDLGIDMDDSYIASNYINASKILYAAFKPFSNSNDFYNKFNFCLAMSAMKGANKSTIEAILSGRESLLGISYSSDYASLNSGIATELCSLLSVIDFAQEYKDLATEDKEVSFANLYKRLTALAAARVSSGWSELKKVFDTDYVSVFGEIINANTSFNSNVESKTYINLFAKKPYASINDIKSKFNSSVLAAVEENKTPSKPSPSRPGGFVSASPSYTNPDNQYDEISGTQNSSDNTSSSVKTSIVIPVLNSEKKSYRDVTADNWEYEAVATLGANNIISGYEDGSFRSNNPITRAEFAKLIVAAFNIKADSVSFNDVNENDWFYTYVSVAAGSGVVNGYEGNFSPNSQITREDAAVIIYRTASLAGQNYSGSAEFTDILDVSVYALHAVRGLANAGIINGDASLCFNPKSNLTRAEAAQMLYNFIGGLAQ